MVAKIVYPQGFEFSDADPKPTYGNNAWKIGQIQPGEKYKIRLRGVMSGDDGEEKVFHTNVGVANERQEQDVAISYSSLLTSVSLRESFIGIDLLFDGKPAVDSIANFGKRIKGRVQWKNNLQSRIVNAEIEVKLHGTALNRTSVSAESGGFYRSSDDTIFWDERGDPTLKVLDVGASGMVDFSFLPLPPISSGGQTITNPMITAEITVRGKRVSESGVPEEIKTVAIKNVRVTSDVQFFAKTIYSFGPIANRGPIPPQVDKETTYTIVWSLMNTSNDVANAMVRAVIPPYVRFTGTVFPAKENVVYNETTKEVVWTPGSIPAGTGVNSPVREVYFQLIISPSLSQIKKSPMIINEQRFTAQDAYTGQEVSQTKPSMDTSLRSDPKYAREDLQVVP
jgi:hypothetical protein